MLMKKIVPSLLLVTAAVFNGAQTLSKEPQIETVRIPAEDTVFKNSVTQADVKDILSEAARIEAAYEKAAQIHFADPETQDHYQGILAFLKDSRERVREYATGLKKQKSMKSFEVYRSFLENESKDLQEDGSLLADFQNEPTSRGEAATLAAISRSVVDASRDLEARFQSFETVQRTIASQF